jgi:hypothetical protein
VGLGWGWKVGLEGWVWKGGFGMGLEEWVWRSAFPIALSKNFQFSGYLFPKRDVFKNAHRTLFLVMILKTLMGL